MAIDRDHMRYCTLSQMFNDSVVKYGDCRCQWWNVNVEEGITASNSYADVGIIVKDLCCGLMEIGVEKGDRVAIMSYNCPQWLWADFAILNAGGIVTTIYPSFSINEMSYIINNSGSKLMFVRDQIELDKVISNLSELTSLKKVIIMEENCPIPDNPIFTNIRALINEGKRYLRKYPYYYEKRWRSIEVWDKASIVYTSGTTGNPKGAVHTHQTFMAANHVDMRNFAHNGYGFNEDDVSLSFLPLSHTYERQVGQFMSFQSGCTIAYCDKPSTIVRDMQIFKPTHFMSVPRIFERIYMSLRDVSSASPEGKAAFEKALEIGVKVIDYRADENGFVDMGFDVELKEGLPEDLKKEYEWADENVFKKVRQMLGGKFKISYSASAGLPSDLCKSFLAMGIRVNEGYGLTETSNTVTLNNLKHLLPGSVGQVMWNVECKLADDGELLFRGENIIQEYWNNPGATNEVFDEDGFFHTGDIGVILPDNYIKIVDRKKAIMCLDTGKNVPRAKVENGFSTSKHIEQICAVADERKFVSALIVPSYAFFIDYFKKNNISFDESEIVYEGEGAEQIIVSVGEDFINIPELKELVDIDIQEHNKNLENYESIKRYVILRRRFLESLDEVTPTFKVKFRNVIKNFADDIEELYS